MPATVSIFYVRAQGGKFDAEYYREKHLPMVSEKWGNHGLQSWEAVEMNTDSPYHMQLVMHWDSVEAFDKAAAHHGIEVFGDVPICTNMKTMIVKGKVVQEWTSKT